MTHHPWDSQSLLVSAQWPPLHRPLWSLWFAGQWLVGSSPSALLSSWFPRSRLRYRPWGRKALCFPAPVQLPVLWQSVATQKFVMQKLPVLCPLAERFNIMHLLCIDSKSYGVSQHKGVFLCLCNNCQLSYSVHQHYGVSWRKGSSSADWPTSLFWGLCQPNVGCASRKERSYL